ncbi:unnamed protein product [Ambrosiozyma monospora]|uniref:Unnamed protein product n=1 Tax=Ambrosiozyma monospora TaxID=43982 RepID=A0ACB5T8B5_AMBMO|nr:unnamed protein product [Ambrosiozyma monospora]
MSSRFPSPSRRSSGSGLRRKSKLQFFLALVFIFLLFHFIVTFSSNSSLETYKTIINEASVSVTGKPLATTNNHKSSSGFNETEYAQLKAELDDAKEQASALHDVNDKLGKAVTETEKEMEAKIAKLQKEHDDLVAERKNFLKSSSESHRTKAKDYIKLEYTEKEASQIDISSGDPLFHNFFTQFLQVLKDNRMSVPHPDRAYYENGKPVIWSIHLLESPQYLMSEDEISDLMGFNDDFINDLTPKHKAVVEKIPPTPPAPFYKGSGYTIVGGGIYSWYSFLAIKQLRNVGSVLPVEVLLPEEEDYESYYCEKLLPKLNAKCIVMSRVFGKENVEGFRLGGYQFKSFALLASSFENTFLMDSDSFAVKNPDPIFESTLYQNFGMITWPDFWRRTTAPAYYKIAGIQIGDKPIRRMNDMFTDPSLFYNSDQLKDYKSQVAYHDRAGTIPDWTSESGELLVRKSTHFDVLLLSAYYNTDGPQGYHPLLSQGGAGEGDKETFVAAAHYYGKPYYQLYKAPDRLGEYYKKSLGKMADTTIVQYDPLMDYEILKGNIARMEKDVQGDDFQYIYEYAYRFPWDKDNVDPMFYHIHDPKLNPFFIMDEEVCFDESHEKEIRNLGDEFGYVGFDVELKIYEDMKKSLCVEKDKFSCFKEENMQKFCKQFVDQRIEFLKKDSEEVLKKFKEDHPVVVVDGNGEVIGGDVDEEKKEGFKEEDKVEDERIFDKIQQDVDSKI